MSGEHVKEILAAIVGFYRGGQADSLAEAFEKALEDRKVMLGHFADACIDDDSMAAAWRAGVMAERKRAALLAEDAAKDAAHEATRAPSSWRPPSLIKTSCRLMNLANKIREGPA